MQTYLITGAAEGLGKALSTHLVHKGHQVILLDKNLKALNALYDELNSENASLYPMDLLGATPDQYVDLHDNIQKYTPKLDGVILNATTLPAFATLEHFEAKQWYEILQVNLNANFHIIQNTLPLLNNAPTGKIIAILDQSVIEHPAYYGAYGVAKSGLKQLMTTLGSEQRNTPLEVYTATLKPFATATRGRLFPGENPGKLPSPEQVASPIIEHLLENKPHPDIQQL